MSSVSKPRVRHNRHKQGLNLTLEKLSADFRYKTMPDGCIKYMMEVVKTNLLEHERLNQESFWIDKDSFSQGIGIYARLKLVDVLDEKVLSIRALREHGIKGNIQAKRECPKETLVFIMDNLI